MTHIIMFCIGVVSFPILIEVVNSISSWYEKIVRERKKDIDLCESITFRKTITLVYGVLKEYQEKNGFYDINTLFCVLNEVMFHKELLGTAGSRLFDYERNALDKTQNNMV